MVPHWIPGLKPPTYLYATTMHNFLPKAYFKGQFIPFADAQLSIATHALHYGTGAFGGLRGIPNPQNPSQILLFRLDRHCQRLSSSARRRVRSGRWTTGSPLLSENNDHRETQRFRSFGRRSRNRLRETNSFQDTVHADRDPATLG